MKLMRILALAFDLKEEAFDSVFRFPITGMQPLLYPPTLMERDKRNAGLGAHSDFSSMLTACSSNLCL
jgi:isopenicillin N synthase-like dioxygenase